MGYSMGGGHSTSIGFGHPEFFAYGTGFIGSGTEDTVVNGGRTHQALTEAGVNHIWSEDPGYGHDYQIWRIYLHRLLQQNSSD